MNAAPSRCRSCQAPIRWAATETGKRMPIDAEPAPDGNITVHRDDTGTVLATVHPVGADLEAPRWTSHFATCPAAGQHRKRQQPETALPVADEVLEVAGPDGRRPAWAPCAGCGHTTLNPTAGQPRCPGCREPLPDGISRVERP